MEIAPGSNVVLYPRVYNRRGDSTLHSVQGVTRDGREINVKLRVDEQLRNRPNVPQITEFARTDISATNPCVATPDNGPGKREGILLLSHVSYDGKNAKGVDTYIARWAVVLAAKASSPEPVFGIGRMEIAARDFDFDGTYKRLISAERGGDQALIAAAKEELFANRVYRYRAIIYHPEAGYSVPGNQMPVFRERIQKTIDSMSGSGVCGGVSVRLLNSAGFLVQEFYREFFPKYKVASSSFQDGAEACAWISQAVETWPVEGGRLLVIPMTRIECGARVNEYYAMDTKHQQLMSQHFTANGLPAVSEVVAKVVHYEETDSTLLSRLFPISPPKGAARHLDLDGGFSGDPALDGSSDGCEFDFFPAGLQRKLIRRSFWLLPTVRQKDIAGNEGAPRWEGMVESVPPRLTLVQETGTALKKDDGTAQRAEINKIRAPEEKEAPTGMAAFLRKKHPAH